MWNIYNCIVNFIGLYSNIEHDIEKMVEANKEKVKPKTLVKETDIKSIETTSPIKGTHIKKRDKNQNKPAPQEKKEKPARVLNGIG